MNRKSDVIILFLLYVKFAKRTRPKAINDAFQHLKRMLPAIGSGDKLNDDELKDVLFPYKIGDDKLRLSRLERFYNSNGHIRYRHSEKTDCISVQEYEIKINGESHRVSWKDRDILRGLFKKHEYVDASVYSSLILTLASNKKSKEYGSTLQLPDYCINVPENVLNAADQKIYEEFVDFLIDEVDLNDCENKDWFPKNYSAKTITNATKAYLNNAHKDYVNRDGLNDVFKKWREDKDYKFFWIHGDVGTGKTAFMAHICSYNEIPVYFCKKGDIQTADPKEFTLFLIRVLCQTLPTYNEFLQSQGESSDNLKQQDADSLFLNYIAEGLDTIVSETTIIIGIDGLDEAFQNGEIKLLNWLTRRLVDLPEWIYFVFTSRNDPYIRRKLGRYKHVDISHVCNENDISKYLTDRLAISNPTELQIEKLTEICKGNFLYATLIANEISDGRIRIEDIGTKAFPDGLGEIFSDCLERRLIDFEKSFYAEHIRPVLEVVCAAYSPMRLETIAHILNTNVYEMTDVLGAICDLFSVKDENKIEPIHISVIEWLCDASYNGALYNRFFVDIQKGHANISKYYISIRQHNYGGDNSLEYHQFLCTHLLAAENLEQAKAVLCDLDFQRDCISILGVNTAIRQYVSDLCNLSKRVPSLAYQVMEGTAFVYIVGEYRRFFYNSGLYFDLAACGLDKILNKKSMEWPLDFHISICNYLYIVKTFQDALIPLKKLQGKYQNEPSISVAEKAELLNMLALCQQKATDYASAEGNYETVLALAQLPKVNEAFALVNMGKIACYKQEENWREKAQVYFERAVESIADEYSLVSCIEPEKKNRLLLAAEYSRIDAYYSIWAGNKVRARDKLQCAKSIYDDLSVYGTASRYYTRYLYTWALYHLSVHNTEEAEQMCNKSLEQITDAKDYDYCQIYFIRALIACSNSDTENCKSLLEKAKTRARKIMGWVELEEIDTLEQYVLGCKKDKLTADTQSLVGKSNIEKWIKNIWNIYAQMLSNDGREEAR